MISQISLHELTRRIRFAQRKVDAATSAADHALRVTEMNARLAPWFASAIRCHADIQHIAPDQHAELQEEIRRQTERELASSAEKAALRSRTDNVGTTTTVRPQGPRSETEGAAPRKGGRMATAQLKAEHLARAVVSMRYCAADKMRAEIANARDIAVRAVAEMHGTRDAAAEEKCKRATDMAILSAHLGCPAFTPEIATQSQPKREAA